MKKLILFRVIKGIVPLLRVDRFGNVSKTVEPAGKYDLNPLNFRRTK